MPMPAPPRWEHHGTVIIEKGRLLLGIWQGIYLVEFDGPRIRQVYVKCIPG